MAKHTTGAMEFNIEVSSAVVLYAVGDISNVWEWESWKFPFLGPVYMEVGHPRKVRYPT